jgi:hypothetical protein
MAIYFIDTFDLKNHFTTLDAAVLEVHTKYEPDAYIHIFEDRGNDGREIVYEGYAKNAVSPLERHIMDASTAALGNRFNTP